jgi:uncharacterized damage-inducible protein DinB
MAESQPEVWLRGPVAGVPAILQPVAHALLQACEEVEELLREFPETSLWSRPAGVASAGFHLQHIRGVVDRLFTYARGEPLSEPQREALAAEGKPPKSAGSVQELVDAFRGQVEHALRQLRATEEPTLTQARAVGRKRLPSTVIGLLFHAAEHVQRHVGQLRVTVRIQRGVFPQP